MSLCLIGLGSNLGDRVGTLNEAAARLGRHRSVRLVATSPWLETRPAGGPPNQPPYLNGAAVLETSLRPDALLDVLQQIEGELGRQRGERWAPRTIDLDLLLYDQLVWSTASLVLPHPRMAWRRFVLEPAALVAGEMIHPQIGWTVRQLLEHLDTSPWYVAICGAVGPATSPVAQQVAQRSGARLLAAPPLSPRGRGAGGEGADVLLEHLRTLEELAGPLKANRPEWRQSDVATVSDFWLEASATAGWHLLPPAAREAYRTGWEKLRAGLVCPRLIVVLEPAAEQAVRRQDGRSWSVAQNERIAAAIIAAAFEPGRGPLLRLPGGDIEAAVSEVVAALEAMK